MGEAPYEKGETQSFYNHFFQVFDLKPGEQPRYLLTCDFQTFTLYDLDEDAPHSHSLANLHKVVERYGFMMGLTPGPLTPDLLSLGLMTSDAGAA